MAIAAEQIVPEIRAGRCRKVNIPNFDNASYFVDPEGSIYSLNNPREPKCLDQELGRGLMWVTLFTKEGLIQKVMVGDIVAHTYLGDEERQAEDTTRIPR